MNSFDMGFWVVSRFEFLLPGPIAVLAELGRNVNERLEAVVREAAVIGDRRTVAAIRTEGVGAATPAPLRNGYLFGLAATVSELDCPRRNRSPMASLST
jgi:hypothetical protein